MLTTRTRADILMLGHLQAVRYGAPLEICNTLLRLAQSADPLPVSGDKTVTLPVLEEIEAE